jgi:exosortase
MDPRKMNKLGNWDRPSWGGALTLLIFAAFFYLYRDVVLDLVKQWLQDQNYNHGLLIPVLSALLIYRALDDLPDRRQASVVAALPLLLPGLVLYCLAQAAAELFTLRISMLLIFWGLVRGLWGAVAFRSLRFPMLFLLFMIPLPYVLFYRVAFPLQLASAAGSAMVLEFLGVPFVRTGNIIHLQKASLDVVTACSGLRSLLALIAFGTLAAGLIEMRRWLKITLVLCSVPIAMFSNGLRIVATAVLVHTSGEAFLHGSLHQAMGLITFAIGIAMVFALGRGFRCQQPSE